MLDCKNIYIILNCITIKWQKHRIKCSCVWIYNRNRYPTWYTLPTAQWRKVDAVCSRSSKREGESVPFPTERKTVFGETRKNGLKKFLPLSIRILLRKLQFPLYWPSCVNIHCTQFHHKVKLLGLLSNIAL